MIEMFVPLQGGSFTLSMDDADVIRSCVWHPASQTVAVYIETGGYVRGSKQRSFAWINARGTAYSVTDQEPVYKATVVKPSPPSIQHTFTEAMAAPGSGVGSRQVIDGVSLIVDPYLEVWHLYQIDYGLFEGDMKALDPKDWSQAEVVSELACILRAKLKREGEDVQRLERAIAAIQAHID